MLTFASVWISLAQRVCSFMFIKFAFLFRHLTLFFFFCNEDHITKKNIITRCTISKLVFVYYIVRCVNRPNRTTNSIRAQKQSAGIVSDAERRERDSHRIHNIHDTRVLYNKSSRKNLKHENRNRFQFSSLFHTQKSSHTSNSYTVTRVIRHLPPNIVPKYRFHAHFCSLSLSHSLDACCKISAMTHIRIGLNSTIKIHYFF